MDNNRYYSGGQSGRPRRPASSYDYLDEPQRRPQQSPQRGGGHNRGPKKKLLPLSLLILVDVMLGALILLVFYITNYVINWQTEPSSLPKPSWLASAPAETSADNTAAASPSGDVTQETPPASEAPADPNDWRAKFPDKFTDGAVEQTENSYKSGNLNVSINKAQENGATYLVADIYVAELKYFKTAFPKNSDSMGDREGTDVIANETNAILAINGDHCVDNPGPVVRNGNSYRLDEKAQDAFVMNYDGSMKAYSASELNLDKIKNEGAYQVWTFGPMLLKDGQPMTEFDSPQSINGKNPRTAVGYYEPGHYCFVVADGRQPGYSEGLDMAQLSQIMYDLGCKEAFNMDGGQSSEMAFMGKLVNQPYNGGRSTTDILYVGEE
jgi:exopolysaccharide biosynthesis protein